MKHLLDIKQLTQHDVQRLMQRAFYFKKKGVLIPRHEATLATMFYENSTRTRISFTLAASRLGMQVVNLDVPTSSVAKGESMGDTLANLHAMGVGYFVIRHSTNGVVRSLANAYDGASLHLINAGDGTHAHPSQALLDFMTILEHKNDVSGLKIAIVGDVLHSRVANSWLELAQLMGVGECVLIAPEPWQPQTLAFGKKVTSLEEGLSDADVIVCLRVQRERLLPFEQLDLHTYRSQYALTTQSIRYAKHDAIVMHPGPVNRGVEMESEIMDGPQSVILQQVENGVYMRMALLEELRSD